MGLKQEARDQAASLLKRYPQNRNVQRIQRDLEVADMNDSEMYAHYNRNEKGGSDFLFQETLSSSWSLDTRMHAFVIWKKFWQDTTKNNQKKSSCSLGRVGVGLRHEFNPDWAIRQDVSAGWDGPGDFGFTTLVDWTPDDYWHLGAAFDSFVVDLPRQALCDDVTAQKLAGTVGYRYSDWREWGLNFSWEGFSDGNDRFEMSFGYEQNLFIRNDWRTRLRFESYYAANSAWDDFRIGYFNPRNGWGSSLRLMTEQTLIDIYHKYFAHRLYLTLGFYDQYAYDADYVGSIMYEQEYTFSDTHALVWNVTYERNLYDGEHEDSYGVTLRWRLRF